MNGVKKSEVRDSALFLSKYVGQIVYLGESGAHALDELVVLQPQWLANVLSSVITFQHNFIKQGILDELALQQILKQYPKAAQAFIVECLTSFKVLVHVAHKNYYIAPSLLPEEPHLHKLQETEIWGFQRGEMEQGKNYRFRFLLIGYMAQIIGRLLLLPSVQLLYTWRNGIVFRYGSKERVYLHLDPVSFSLKLRVRANISIPTSELLALGQTSYILDSTLSILYNAKDETQVQSSIPCPHCLTLISQFGGRTLQMRGNTNEAPACSLNLFEEDVHEFSLHECISAIGTAATTLLCPLGQEPVEISWAAPDVMFSSIDIIEDSDLFILDTLGKGGFGSVFKAKLRRTGHSIDVAVKELTISSEASDKAQETSKFSEFLAEVSFMRKLSHKCIVQLYGIRLNPKPGMVMEYLPIGDLFRFLAKADENLSWKFRMGVAWDISRAMTYMNKSQLVHRDLRSENILLSSLDENSSVRAKLADFGLSRQLLEVSVEFGHDIWQYNPPERLQENKYSAESDVYSFGICCWELASRQVPFGEWEDSDVYYKLLPNGHKEINVFKIKGDIIKGLRPSIHLIDKGCPSEFTMLIEACWATNLSQRPTFAHLSTQLESLYCMAK